MPNADANTDAPPLDAGEDASELEALPETLSEAGLFAEGVSGAFAPGVRSYDGRYPLWTDDAEKARHILLPEGGRIDVNMPNHWAFPVGTRVYKEFRVEGMPVETRLLWKRSEGDWVYVRTYSGPTAAMPMRRLKVRRMCWARCTFSGPVPKLPPGQQRLCPWRWGGTARARALRDVDRRGLLPPETQSADVPGDAIEQAALGYLHANCGHCHGENHPLARTRELWLWLPVGVADPMDTPAWQTSAGIRAFHELGGTDTLVVPGDADASQLYLRMDVRDETQMPPLARSASTRQGSLRCGLGSSANEVGSESVFQSLPSLLARLLP